MLQDPGDRFTKVIVNRKSKITITISLRARILTVVRFTKLVLILRVTTYDLRQVTSPITEGKKRNHILSRKLITLKFTLG